MLVSLTELVVCILAFQVWISRSWILTIKTLWWKCGILWNVEALGLEVLYNFGTYPK